MGDSIEYVGYIEAKLSLPMGSLTFEIEAPLLVFPIEYQKRLPVAIGITITDMAADFIHENNPKNLCPNHGRQCAVPPNLEDWYRHTPVRKGSSRLL